MNTHGQGLNFPASNSSVGQATVIEAVQRSYGENQIPMGVIKEEPVAGDKLNYSADGKSNKSKRSYVSKNNPVIDEKTSNVMETSLERYLRANKN